jgi:hypothetical protein
MPSEQDFCDDPLAFMAQHIVIADYVPSKPGKTFVQIGVDDMTSQGWTVASGPTGAKVFRLYTRPDNYSPSISAYICPYGNNEVNTITLGNDCLWMFTALMDGCTFGVGSQGTGANGTVRVAHVNSTDATKYQPKDIGQEAQAKLQRNLTKTQVGRDGSLIEPADYKPMADGSTVMQSTTFGTHPLGKAWSFYTQTYTWIAPVGNHAQMPRRYIYGALTQRA